MEPSGTELPCVACGYDLRAAAAGDPCPECGLPASRSRRFWTELEDPSARRNLAATRIGAAALLISLALLPAIVVDDPLREFWRQRFGLELDAAYLANAILADGVAAVALVGAWLIARHDARTDGPRRSPLAVWLRLAACGLILVRLLAHAGRVTPPGAWQIGGSDAYVALRMAAEFAGIAIASLFAGLVALRLARIAAGVESQALGRRLVRCGLVWAATPIVLLAVFVAEPAAGRDTFLRTAILASWIAWLIVLLLAAVATLVSLAQVNLVLRGIARRLARRRAGEPTDAGSGPAARIA